VSKGRPSKSAGAEASAPPPVTLGLAPREEPDALIVSLISAAVEEVWPRPVANADVTDPAHRVWRFSGRWWNKPTPMRRERPWTNR
jgi:hypothetical protein